MASRLDGLSVTKAKGLKPEVVSSSLSLGCFLSAALALILVVLVVVVVVVVAALLVLAVNHCVLLKLVLVV